MKQIIRYMYQALIVFLVVFPAVVYGNTEVELRGDEILYNGPLTKEANSKVFDLYESAKSKPALLAITSPGGGIDVGLQLGEWVLSRGLHIKITEFCFSSCANYVFPAGKTKILGESAVVGFHGGASSEDYDDSGINETLSTLPPGQRASVREQITLELEKYLSENRKREAAFYTRLGVSAKLNVLGQDPKYDAFSNEGYQGWYYSLDDMKELGLTNIVILNGEWRPEARSREYRLFRVEVHQ